ncbi:hypothetical protein CLOP_g16260 [Closterium sp. NIES-67]|nr:hypothetical protein CLOP_g16260 [Closterium sp. NIES-67]
MYISDGDVHMKLEGSTSALSATLEWSLAVRLELSPQKWTKRAPPTVTSWSCATPVNEHQDRRSHSSGCGNGKELQDTDDHARLPRRVGVAKRRAGARAQSDAGLRGERARGQQRRPRLSPPLRQTNRCRLLSSSSRSSSSSCSWGEGEAGEGEDESDAPCFATLRINATAVDLEAYYNKAVNYTLMVTLSINATAVDLEAYYSKAVNYTLMVTFVSFLQVLFIIRQMEHSNTQSGAAKVSMLMVGQQAIMDAYLCLLHLTAGIVVGAESLFNAFATAAFFKFVIFSIFEMRYLLAIWKARRPAQSSESWDLMRRELSILYSRFYGFLLGGILLNLPLQHGAALPLLLFYSFWIPQIVTSVIRDSRKPLHVHYILGMSATRLAIPLYISAARKTLCGWSRVRRGVRR